MRLLPVTLVCFLASAATLLPAGNTAAADQVKIYRCVAADGSVAVRDSACPDGETQQVRDMTRPKDPAPAPASAQPQPHPYYYYAPASAYDGVSSGGGVVVRRPVYPVPAPAPAQPADWGHGSWVKGSWTDSGSWTDR